jgi:molecular chaperone GrpE
MNDTPDNRPTEDGAQAEGPADDSLASLQAQLLQAEARAATARDAQLRAIAELDNVRRRLEREFQTGLKYANENLLRELVSVCDSLELGLKAAEKADMQDQAKALVEGKQLTYRQLMALLEKNGVRQLDPAGKPFNPDQHQAMSMVESAEVPPNHVLNVMQKGYTLHDRLLRPATVVVAKAPP